MPETDLVPSDAALEGEVILPGEAGGYGPPPLRSRYRSSHFTHAMDRMRAELDEAWEQMCADFAKRSA